MSYALHVSKTRGSPLHLSDLTAYGTIDKFFSKVGPTLRDPDFNQQQIPLRFIMNEAEHVSISHIKAIGLYLHFPSRTQKGKKHHLKLQPSANVSDLQVVVTQ